MLNALRRHAHPLARFGCAAIGTVYVLIGGVALLALTGHFIEYADEDRIGVLVRQAPGGVALLWAIAAGAAGWVVWRALEALTDPYELGGGWSGVVKRTGQALSGLAYGLVAWSAARAALGHAPASRDAAEQQQQAFVAVVLHWPGGAWIVGLAGAIVVIVGVIQFVLVARRAYTTEIRMVPNSRGAALALHALAAYGYSARGVILCILGYFLLRGAVSVNPAAVGDTDTAFDFIGGGVVGDTAFAIVALGTVAFGLFMYANAWLYRFERDAGDPEAGSRSRA